ncbi:hypothetical protein PHYSODRAFT_312017 [Phytophthora sojae]|uniref:Tc1-like transposase DDE domain-containing protein n=1 Tax=Phytophthora sojae (strain P6497) TaxID=1094619 RepID=G4YX82_PHYSP|nr:hypothetical protein PHYSODRAFT_312017 [Phytophthora sojae]EGZ25650.1 hypothetical protein PHYSODRAFT_312017 [Phytophthora sojae]|eukprot:XP_009520938.1 hypothetical protein PHYSODRAFT_312017 [Phytophthora sojae]
MPYRKNSLEERQRVLTAAKHFEDWALTAKLNGVPYPTAWRWVTEARKTNHWTALKVKFDVDFSTQTVRNALDAVCFTLKKTHAEPAAMNTDRVKALRREYVAKIIKAQAQRKRILYFDETNFNLFCTRTYGWSRRGSRAVVVRSGPRGENLSVIACISAHGLEHVEYRLLDGLMDAGVSMIDCVVVCDNASIHTNVEDILHRAEYAGSPMLNPIKNVFSVFKSEVKAYLSAERDAILRAPPGQTKSAHRAEYLLRAVRQNMCVKVTSDLCDSEAAHTLSFHPAALVADDMPVGV